jgi:hypothetical protein
LVGDSELFQDATGDSIAVVGQSDQEMLGS